MQKSSTSRPAPDFGDIRREPLDLDADPLDVLRRLRNQPRLFALFGSWHHGDALIAFDPVAELDDPYSLGDPAPTGEGVGGGWMGAWLYDGSCRVGFYDTVLRRTGGSWWIESLGPLAPHRRQAIDRLIAGPGLAHDFTVGAFVMTPDPERHRGGVARTVEHIRAGDIFQANLCMRLDAGFGGDPLDLFCVGVDALHPAYAAYVSHPGGTIASFSPELFLRRTGRDVLTSPIKGTAPLDENPTELAASVKDRAENTMIVDLMRNDLGRVAVPGSVRVPALLRTERHAVWHLVSDVIAHLEAGVSDGDLLTATFPPGSVTGAPKARAMEIIDELEPTVRHAYTGAIGHIGGTGLELNVAIRTFEFGRRPDGSQHLWLGVGGGIVADSDPQAEYAECLTKAMPLIEAIGGTLGQPPDLPAKPALPPQSVHQPVMIDGGVFETVLVIDDQPVGLDAHLSRLDASVRGLWGATIRAGLEAAVRRKVAGLNGRHRLRIEAQPSDGEARICLDVAELADDPGPWRLRSYLMPGGLGAHKWTDRGRLPAELGTEPLLIDTDGSVLETGRASVFLVLSDGIHTPALDGRILPGTMREQIIERAEAIGHQVHQHRTTTEMLAAASEVFVTNALRGVVSVSVIDDRVLGGEHPVTDMLSQRPQREGAARAVVQEHRPRVLFIDNYDSFVFNLVQYVRELGAEAEVLRNDDVRADAIGEGDFSHVVISPGPGGPADAGISADLVRRLGSTTPTLGVCLGHQVIADVYGARVAAASEVVHGKSSLVHHDGAGVFAGLPNPLTCGRYHSLAVVDLPSDLIATAHTDDGTLMGLRHRKHPVEGVQFHPESVLTRHGHDLLVNFLSQVRHGG